MVSHVPVYWGTLPSSLPICDAQIVPSSSTEQAPDVAFVSSQSDAFPT